MGSHLQLKAAELALRGADPRRADPRYARPIVLTWRQAAKCLVVAVGIGVLLAALLYGAVVFSFDLHLAKRSDIRLASILRAARPDADALSQDDLVACASVPIDMVRALAPIASTDPAWTAVETGWLDKFVDAPAHLMSGERIAALGRLLNRLAALPEDRQVLALRDVVGVFRFTDDPTNRALLLELGRLSGSARASLAASRAYEALLGLIASLPEPERQAFLDLLTDPVQREAAFEAARLDPSIKEALAGMAKLDKRQGQRIAFVSKEIGSMDPAFLTFLDIFYRRDPALMRLLQAPSHAQ